MTQTIKITWLSLDTRHSKWKELVLDKTTCKKLKESDCLKFAHTFKANGGCERAFNRAWLLTKKSTNQSVVLAHDGMDWSFRCKDSGKTLKETKNLGFGCKRDQFRSFFATKDFDCEN